METSQIRIVVYNPVQEGTKGVYVLSRGANTGKVQKVPSLNTYAIYAPDEVLPLVEATANILFQSRRLRPYLHGTCIEFVRIQVYRSLFNELWRTITPEVIAKVAKQLEVLEQFAGAVEKGRFALWRCGIRCAEIMRERKKPTEVGFFF